LVLCDPCSKGIHKTKDRAKSESLGSPPHTRMKLKVCKEKIWGEKGRKDIRVGKRNFHFHLRQCYGKSN
jgi:hypothetical protein